MPAVDRWISKGELNHVMILYIATRGDCSQRNWIAAFVQSLLRGGTISTLNSVLTKWVSNIEPNHALALVCFNMGVNLLVWMKKLGETSADFAKQFFFAGRSYGKHVQLPPSWSPKPGETVLWLLDPKCRTVAES